MASQMAGSTNTRGAAFPAIYPGASQKVVLSTSHAESTAVGANTTCVQLTSDVDCWIAIGAAPVSTTSACYVPAKSSRLFACNGGDKVSAIASGAGNLYLTEGA